MKLLVYLILFCNHLFTYFPKTQIVGKWLYGGVAEKRTKAEHLVKCPYLIEFRSNGTYTVMNDCYGDAVKPIVETGKWQLTESSKKLIFSERRFTTNYHLYSPKRTIEISILSLDEKKLKVRFAQERTEVYTKEK